VETLAKTLLVFSLLLAVVAGVSLLVSHLGITRLPGDILVRRRNVTVYVPLGLSSLVSVLLTIVLNLLSRR
jgi:hypothetical protein